MPSYRTNDRITIDKSEQGRQHADKHIHTITFEARRPAQLKGYIIAMQQKPACTSNPLLLITCACQRQSIHAVALAVMVVNLVGVVIHFEALARGPFKCIEKYMISYMGYK
jgi:hypothetical protein